MFNRRHTSFLNLLMYECPSPYLYKDGGAFVKSVEWGGGGVAAAAKLLQSCPTLCDPIDSSPPGSAVPGMNGGGGQPKNIS